MDLSPDFRDLLEELGRAGVEYVVVGGYAVAFHGRPRATKDLDLVIRGTAKNLERASAALRAFGAPPHVADAVLAMAENEIVFLGEAPMRVDLLRTVEGVPIDDLFARAVPTELDGISLQVISLDDLITNKRAVGRPRDQDDAAFLERVRARRG